MRQIENKLGQIFKLRRLNQKDAEALGCFFELLPHDTKEIFSRHPLTKNYATYLCHKTIEHALRFVLLDNNMRVQAYFILDYNHLEHEVERYRGYGIELHPAKDLFFTPVVSDNLQNTGLASRVMPPLINIAKEDRASSIVVYGGCRHDNEQALAFYRKTGFEKVGGYNADTHFNDMRLML